jgi:hypothetical protein
VQENAALLRRDEAFQNGDPSTVAFIALSPTSRTDEIDADDHVSYEQPKVGERLSIRVEGISRPYLCRRTRHFCGGMKHFSSYVMLKRSPSEFCALTNGDPSTVAFIALSPTSRTDEMQVAQEAPKTLVGVARLVERDGPDPVVVLVVHVASEFCALTNGDPSTVAFIALSPTSRTDEIDADDHVSR